MTRSESPNENRASSSQPFHPKDLNSLLSNDSLGGSVGTYQNGKIHWRQTGHMLPAKDGNKEHVTEKTTKPKIQVLIPGIIRERPLPALPFFVTADQQYSASASIHNSSAHEVSPPLTDSKAVARNSIVSPLNQNHKVPQPVSFGQFQRSMSYIVRKTSVRPPQQSYQVLKPNGSSVDSDDSDSVSMYSEGSSDTSLEPDSSSFGLKEMHRYSVQNPVAAGVFDSPKSLTREFITPPTSRPRQYDQHHPSIEQDQVFQRTCPLRRSRNAPGALSYQSPMDRTSSKRSSQQHGLAKNHDTASRGTGRKKSKHSPTLSEAENDLEEHLTFLSQEADDSKKIDAESGLKTSPESDSSVWSATEIQKTPIEFLRPLPEESIDINTSTAPAPPALPRKSSKRRRSESGTYRPSRVLQDHVASQLERGRPTARKQELTPDIPEPRQVGKDIEPSPVPDSVKSVRRIITPSCAESVILNIYRNLDSFDDLFATAVVNQGFYRVFKRHELDLIRSTLRKISPPAWEYREIAFPGHDMLHDEDLEMTRPQEEYTPFSYLHMLKHDIHVMRSIKMLIKEKCQSYIRPEISAALTSADEIETRRVDDALWRIWTFCKIFGSGKAREDDIVAQQDWLKGGPMVHQETCSFSIQSTDYMSDTLISAPDCFARGNRNGLSAEQLFDMMELWGCLATLLHEFSDDTTLRTTQARACGVYDKTEILAGDIDSEESMLEEWCSYVLTFGLSAVLDLASANPRETDNPFKGAAQQGWIDWSPPASGSSRRYFLKEATSRVYEERIARTFAPNSSRSFGRQLSKERRKHHIAELRKRRVDTTGIPVLSFSQERPMSEWSTVIGGLECPLPNASSERKSFVPRVPSALAQELTASIAELPLAENLPAPSLRSFSPPRRITAKPLLPTPPASSVHSMYERDSTVLNMPSIKEHPAHGPIEKPDPNAPSLMDHPAFRPQNPITTSKAPSSLHLSTEQHTHRSPSTHSSTYSHRSIKSSTRSQRTTYSTASYEDTTKKAIAYIVDMGFSADEAKQALRMTNGGYGLKVDRAVNLLLSRER